MGNVKIEFGSPLILELKLDDQDATKFVRAIVRDGAGATVTGSPFTLSHVANGRYRNTSFTPAAEGYFTADYQVYNDAGFTQLSNKYKFVYDLFKVDDTEANVQGLRDNYTNGRAALIDNLDTTVSSRQSEADALSRFNSVQSNIDANEAKIDIIDANVDSVLEDTGTTLPAQINTRQSESDALSRFNTLNGKLDTIDSIVDSILVDTGTDIPALINALNNLSINDVQTALTNQGYSSARALLLDNLNATISSRASQVSVDTIDSIVDAILVDTDQTIPGLIAALETKAQADTRQSALIAEHDSTQLAISNLNDPTAGQVADAVWDELESEHEIAGSFGNAISRLNDIIIMESDVPDITARPPAGSISKTYFVRLFNSRGRLADPDSNLVNVRIEDPDGTVLVATTAMTRIDVGQYEFDDTYSPTTPLGERIVLFEYHLDGDFVQHVAVIEVLSADFGTIEQQLDALDAKIGSPAVTIADDIATIDSLVDAIKAKTDQITFVGGLVETVAQTVNDKTGYSLTVAERDAIAVEVESHLLDDGDGQMLLNAIVGAIGNENVDEIALVAAIRADLERVGGTLDTIDNTTTDIKSTVDTNLDVTVSSRESEVNALARATDSQSRDNTTQNKIDAVQDTANDIDSKTTFIKAKTDQFTFSGSRVNSMISSSQENEIAEKTWDQLAADHQVAGSFGKILSLLSGEGASLTPESIAQAVWDSNLADHTDSQTFGERVQTIKNRLDIVNGKIDTTNSRLTASRASKIDNLDVVLSTRQSTIDADAKQSILVDKNDAIKAVVDGLSLVVGEPDPEVGSILSLLNNPTYGLANLKILIDSRSSQASQNIIRDNVNSIVASIADASYGLAAQRARIDVAIDLLNDSDFGLSRLRTELDTKAGSNELDWPTVAEIREAVWSKAIASTFQAGSIGARVKDNLDASMTSRASQSSVDAIDAIVDNILDQLLNATYGLPELKDAIMQSITDIGQVGTDLDTHDQNLNDSRAQILAAINAITDGTSTIISAIDAVKGAGWSSATDTLERISDRIGAGLAIETKQDQIISAIGTVDGKQDALSTKLDQNNSEIQANRTQIGSKVDAVKAQTNSIEGKVDATKAEIDNPVYGLEQAKDDRNAHAVNTFNGQASLSSKIDNVGSLVTALDGVVDGYQIDLLNAIANIDDGGIKTLLNGVIALLQDGSVGLSKIKQEILSVKAQEESHYNASFTKLTNIQNKSNTIEGLVTAIQGAGFSASDSLTVIKSAIETLATDESDNATQSQAQAILDQLEIIKDGQTGDYNASTDSLHAISEQDRELQGISGSGV